MFKGNRSRRGAVLTALVTVLVLASTVLTGTAATGQSPALSADKYRDYRGVGLEVGASGMEQCSLPLSQRHGRWLCPAPTKPSHRTTLSRPAEGYCEAWACRYRYDDFLADMSVHGIWGWNGEPLGQMDGYADIQLQGAQSVSNPVRYVNTRATKNVVFTGDLLNSAPGVEGDQIEGKWSIYGPIGSIPANASHSWSPNGYKAYDNTMWDHSLVHQFSFEADGYPGYWYLYVKSTCTNTNDKQIYRYYDVRQVPANSDGGGWRR